MLNLLPRPTVQFTGSPTQLGLLGFANVEGCFLIGTMKYSDQKMVKQVQLEFNISQHIRDLELINTRRSRRGGGK
jgi:hypothetical protein